MKGTCEAEQTNLRIILTLRDPDLQNTLVCISISHEFSEFFPALVQYWNTLRFFSILDTYVLKTVHVERPVLISTCLRAPSQIHLSASTDVALDFLHI